MALKADESARVQVIKESGIAAIRSAVLVRRAEHGDTFVFGDHLTTAPGIHDTLCHPYSFDSTISPHATTRPLSCPQYTQTELLGLLFHFIASKAGQGATQVSDFAVVVPKVLSQEEKETFAVALAVGFKCSLAQIRVRFMTESVANLAYIVHEDKAKRPQAGDRIVAVHYGSSHSQVVAFEHSKNAAPTILYDGSVEAGSKTFEDCIEKELNARTGPPGACRCCTDANGHRAPCV